MKFRKKVYLIVTLIVLLFILLVVYMFIPKIRIVMNGSNEVILGLNETYVDAGAKAEYRTLFEKKPLEVRVFNFVDNSSIGIYKVIYKASYENYEQEVYRTVKVVDNISPELSLNSDIKYCRRNKTAIFSATAVDNIDGDISDRIQYEIKDNGINIFVVDSSNNKSEIFEEFLNTESDVPEIFLNGNKKIYLNKGNKYIEQGATANDVCDGDLSDKISIQGSVDTNKVGTYVLTYTVSDLDGNESQISRTVIVNEDSGSKVVNGATIYLTFDDGPHKNTQKILDVLDKYNVKATFFVTNQFPSYQDMIKEEFNRGHTVGIHTYSHKWEIYTSTETYLEDFNKIQAIIKKQTGNETKFFRFPGGSSNTVSRKYCNGIMTKLTSLMTKKGYTYFDWTFDSGDTVRGSSSKEDIVANVKHYLKGDGEYIILMHDIKENTALALPEIIEYARNNGYKFAKIDENTTAPHFKIAN